MDDLLLIKTKADLSLLFYKIKFSLEEIKTNRPERTDYIDSMTESLIWLGDAIRVYSNMERELRTSRSRCFDLERINLELNTDNQRLTKLVKDLTDKIQL